MDLFYIEFNSLYDLKKYWDSLPRRRVVIMLGQRILLSEFTAKEIEQAEDMDALHNPSIRFI